MLLLLFLGSEGQELGNDSRHANGKNRKGGNTTLAAEKMTNSAAGCNLVGQRGRGCRNLDLILLLGVVTYCSQLSLANPCTKCHERVRIGRLTQYVLNYHAHINSECYDRTKLEKCEI